MAAKTRADNQDSATDAELYLPAGITSPSEASRIERLWRYLFNHDIDSPK